MKKEKDIHSPKMTLSHRVGRFIVTSGILFFSAVAAPWLVLSSTKNEMDASNLYLYFGVKSFENISTPSPVLHVGIPANSFVHVLQIQPDSIGVLREMDIVLIPIGQVEGICREDFGYET